MEYHADRDSYICLNGRELTVTNERRSKTTSGYVSVKTYYRSPDCTGCPYKTECIKGNNCKTPMEKRNKSADGFKNNEPETRRRSGTDHK